MESFKGIGTPGINEFADMAGCLREALRRGKSLDRGLDNLQGQKGAVKCRGWEVGVCVCVEGGEGVGGSGGWWSGLVF